MMTQLQPPIPLLTPKGRAWAVALLDYGPHWDLQWVTFLHESGECWTFRNSQIRQERNETFGLPEPSRINEPRPAAIHASSPKTRDERKNPSLPGAANESTPQTRRRAVMQALLDNTRDHTITTNGTAQN